MSDFNTGKPSDMSDASKAFNSGFDAAIYDQAKVSEALIKVHAEKLAAHQVKAEQAAVSGDLEKAKAEHEALVKANAQATSELEVAIAKHAKVKAEHDAILAERNAPKG